MSSHKSEAGDSMYDGGIRFSPDKVEFFLRKSLAQLAESFDVKIKFCKRAPLFQRFLPAEWAGYINSTDPKHNPKGLIKWFTERYPDKEFHVRQHEPQEVEVFKKGYKDKTYFQ